MWACLPGPCCPQVPPHQGTKVHQQRTKEQQLEHKQKMPARDDDHMQHCVGGLPQCKHCGHRFSAWPAFMSHISRHCCPVLRLGEEQPPEMRDREPDPPPLSQDPGMLQQAREQTLEQLAASVHARNRRRFCPICGLWLTKPRFLKSHIVQQHANIKTRLPQRHERLKCLPAGPKLCPYCHLKHDRGRVACPVFQTAAILHDIARNLTAASD